jgi:uncharacterized membrane protein
VTLDVFVTRVGVLIDAAGVAAIVLGVAVATLVAVRDLRRGADDVYGRFRQFLGRSILLGLELLVAADIVRTVGTKPTLEGVAVLAAIVAIRTFLSLSLELEISGRRPRRRGDPGGEQ